jgi:hypothetical protein
MKRILALILILLFGAVGLAYGQSAKKAYESLKRLEAKTQVGIAFNDYLKTLGEAKYEVNAYAENRNTKLAGYLQLAIFHYELAAQTWDVSKPLVQKNWDSASAALYKAKILMK